MKRRTKTIKPKNRKDIHKQLNFIIGNYIFDNINSLAIIFLKYENNLNNILFIFLLKQLYRYLGIYLFLLNIYLFFLKKKKKH